MPKPHGTYLRISRQDRIAYRARKDKETPIRKNNPQTRKSLDAMQRKMALVQDWIKSGALASKTREDKIRESLAEAIDMVEEYIEKYQAQEIIRKELREPIYPILRTQPAQASHADLLILAIALCKVFSVLVRTVGRK